MKQQCSNCRFWDKDTEDTLDDDDKVIIASCTRYPPRQRRRLKIAVFPTTFDFYWCGEWQPVEVPL